MLVKRGLSSQVSDVEITKYKIIKIHAKVKRTSGTNDGGVNIYFTALCVTIKLFELTRHADRDRDKPSEPIYTIPQFKKKLSAIPLTKQSILFASMEYTYLFVISG